MRSQPQLPGLHVRLRLSRFTSPHRLPLIGRGLAPALPGAAEVPMASGKAAAVAAVASFVVLLVLVIVAVAMAMSALLVEVRISRSSRA